MRDKGTAKVHRIAARSELGDRYASTFKGMRMETQDRMTILAGEIVDRPLLFGILERLNRLGPELLSVEVLSEYAYPSAKRCAAP